MSYDEITVTQAAQRPAGTELQPNEKDYTGPDGTRSAMLLRVSDPVTEASTMPGSKKPTWTHRTWTFCIDDQSEWDGQILQRRVAVTSSNSDKSLQYEIMNALAGKTVPVGVTLSISQHLINRSCYIRIITENDYPRIAGFMALPQAPVKGKPEPVTPGADGLPF